MKYIVIVILFFSIKTFAQSNVKQINFPSEDGLEITANIYETNVQNKVILLCHQAGYSRGEYNEIAVTLNKLGYNCVAIDQRSGNKVNGVKNETFQKATIKGLATKYLNAEQDIRASVKFIAEKYNQNIIIWGSSYSASLVLKVANENEKVDAVLSFSPGEYFSGKMILAEKIKGLNKPSFITSSKKEASRTKKLFNVIESKNKTQFIPKLTGYHGSKALWKGNKGNEEYWQAVKKFLSSLE